MLLVRGLAKDVAVDCESAIFPKSIQTMRVVMINHQGVSATCAQVVLESHIVASRAGYRTLYDDWSRVSEKVASRVILALPTRKVVASRPTPDFTQTPLCADKRARCSAHLNYAHINWVTMRFVLSLRGRPSQLGDRRCPSLPPIQPPNIKQFTIAIQHVVRQSRCRSK